MNHLFGFSLLQAQQPNAVSAASHSALSAKIGDPYNEPGGHMEVKVPVYETDEQPGPEFNPHLGDAPSQYLIDEN